MRRIIVSAESYRANLPSVEERNVISFGREEEEEERAAEMTPLRPQRVVASCQFSV